MLRSLELPLIVGDGGHQRGEFPFADTVTDSKYMAKLAGRLGSDAPKGRVSALQIKRRGADLMVAWSHSCSTHAGHSHGIPWHPVAMCRLSN